MISVALFFVMVSFWFLSLYGYRWRYQLPRVKLVIAGFACMILSLFVGMHLYATLWWIFPVVLSLFCIMIAYDYGNRLSKSGYIVKSTYILEKIHII